MSIKPDASGGARTPAAAAAAILDIVLGVIATIDLVFLTMVTVVDVVGRYLFDAPLRCADELSVFALAVAVFAGLPLAIARGGLISVEILVLHLPRRLRRIAKLVTDTISALFLAYAGWQLVAKAGKLAAYGDATMFLRIPTAPFAWGMAAACFFAAALYFGLAVAAVLGRDPSTEDDEALAGLTETQI